MLARHLSYGAFAQNFHWGFRILNTGEDQFYLRCHKMDSAKNKVYNERNKWDPLKGKDCLQLSSSLLTMYKRFKAIVYLFLIDPTLIKKTFKDFLWVSSFLSNDLKYGSLKPANVISFLMAIKLIVKIKITNYKINLFFKTITFRRILASWSIFAS